MPGRRGTGERMRRMGVLVAVLTLLGCPWASGTSDAATVMDVDCTSNVEGSFSPGTTFVDIYDPCKSTDSTLKSGKRHPQLTGTTGKEDIVWNNGAVSTWEYTREVMPANGSVRVHQEGTITAGLFAGDHAVEDLTVLLPGVYLGASEEPTLPRRYVATGRLQISKP